MIKTSTKVQENTATERIDPQVWRITGVVLLGPLMTQMDSTVVNVSLSTIRRELHASIDSVQWIISGYLLALALMLPLNAWLVDRLGAKRLYLGCFSAFTVASLLCGSAKTIDELIGARLVQGIAGGLLAPMTQMMLARIAGRQMARVMGYAVMPVLVAPIIGPVVAGAILKYADWPWLFYVNLPIGILAVTLAALTLPADTPSGEKRPFDMPGFLLISPGLAILLYGVDHVQSREGLIGLLAGLSMIGAFVRHALRKADTALIDVRLFRNRIFAAAARTQFLSNGATFAGQMLIPLYLIAGCGFSAARAGWMLAPMGIGMLFVYPSMGYLTERFGCRPVAVSGTILSTLGTIAFLWMADHRFLPALMLTSLMVRGAGQSGIGLPSITAAYASVPKEKLALATTAANIVQRIGGPIATTALALLMSFTARRFPAPGPHAFVIPFMALIGLQVLVFSSASRLPSRIPQNRSSQDTAPENP